MLEDRKENEDSLHDRLHSNTEMEMGRTHSETEGH